MYTGKSETLRADAFRTEPGWTSVTGVPELRQKNEVDCGPVALTMVTQYWAKDGQAPPTPIAERVSAGDLRDAARAAGYRSFLVEGTLNDIEHELQQNRPVIVGMAKPTSKGALGHYEVVVGLNKERELIATHDPALGARRYSFEAFLTEWIQAGRPLIVIIGPPKDSVLQPVAGLEDPGDDRDANGGERQGHP
jgi:ABC-type bacteriocin/lantibiotic exporter with double-glycine peptidase domain